MDTGYTYSTSDWIRASVYAPPEFEPPATLQLARGDELVTFMRVSDRSLYCGKVADVTGDCDNFECHRRVLGECQCGRHAKPVRFTKAGS